MLRSSLLVTLAVLGVTMSGGVHERIHGRAKEAGRVSVQLAELAGLHMIVVVRSRVESTAETMVVLLLLNRLLRLLRLLLTASLVVVGEGEGLYLAGKRLDVVSDVLVVHALVHSG